MQPRTLITGVLLGAALAAAHGSSVGCSHGACPSCDGPAIAGTLANDLLFELSGVAASPTFENVFYAHNDSGDSSRLFVFDRTGADLGVLQIDASNQDWEDMAAGPCDAGVCLYIGDIGDNYHVRTEYSIYRVAEPSVMWPVTKIPAERIDFTYPNGAQDAEVLLVHPVTGAVTLVTKVKEGPSSIFELPHPLVAGTMHEAVKVGEIEPINRSSQFTGGAVHPDGTGILMLTRTDLFYYAMTPEQTVAEALLGDPCPRPLANEESGEAVTWLPDGSGFMVLSEGKAASVVVAACDP